MSTRLPEFCNTCKSHYYCGRPCPRAPATAAVAEPTAARVTKPIPNIVTKRNIVTANSVTVENIVTPPRRRRGRPPKGAAAMSAAERMRAYRARRTARRTTEGPTAP